VASDDKRPYIECRDLFKIYKRADIEVVALRGLDMEAPRGEMLAVVGASGSGKSTLLNILSGLDRPSAGQARVGNRDLIAMTDRELVAYRRTEVGFVWQSVGRNLLPYLTARENVELPMAIAGAPARERRERSAMLLSTLGLADRMTHLPAMLSGGEQQRVAIAVALANSPPLLLADEPTGELDTRSATEVFEQLGQMNRTLGTTIVIVTHYPGIARHVERVVQIRDGRISAETLVHPSFRRQDDRAAEEYVVVDHAGRLQLPQGFAERLRLKGRARVTLGEGGATIRPPEEQR
jgi:ABC-type lipoprotein export system ATPase subunit